MVIKSGGRKRKSVDFKLTDGYLKGRCEEEGGDMKMINV